MKLGVCFVITILPILDNKIIAIVQLSSLQAELCNLTV